jgi:prevent-host-death family protein
MVMDYSKIELMEEIAVSKFKATCLAVIERVRKTRKPVRITRFGKPLAEVVPPSTPDRPPTWLGSLAGTGTITGDLVSPAVEEDEWEALQN